MTLLVLATLFAQSLANIWRVDTGMRTESLVTFSVSPELNGYSPERTAELFDRLEEGSRRAARGHGRRVVDGAAVVVLELEQRRHRRRLRAQSRRADDAAYNSVGTGFLRTLGISLLAGRDFTDSDIEDRPQVAIVNREFARQLWARRRRRRQAHRNPRRPRRRSARHRDRGSDRRRRVFRR